MASSAYLEIIDFFAAGTTPQTVAHFQPSAGAQARVAILLATQEESALSADEKAELDHYMELEHILRLAKARARLILAGG
jgi:hypothetical protein